MDWWRERHDARTAVRVMCTALQPGFHFPAPDPGNQLRGRLVRGHLDDQDLQTLTTLWPKVEEILRDSTNVPWDLLLQLVNSWRHVYPSSLADIGIAASTRAITRRFAERMLHDLAHASVRSPGVQHEIRKVAARFGVSVETTTDTDFEDLYLSARVADDNLSSTPRRRANPTRDRPLPRNASSTRAALAAIVGGTATRCSPMRRAVGPGIGSPSMIRPAVIPSSASAASVSASALDTSVRVSRTSATVPACFPAGIVRRQG